MATVYLARLTGMGGFKRFVAIKRLHPHLAKEQEFIEMFMDEARLAARLHHPNVVPILEIGVSDNQYYLVMEYIEGDTAGYLQVRAYNAGARFPPNISIRIMLDTLTGLHAAHELADENGTPLNVVHRDVSPQNILVGIDGVSRITDFGVAKASARLTNTQAGQLKGKLAYMSPEQVKGGGVDRRADIFAAGTVLWEMLAGQRLFKADADAETLFRVVAADVPALSPVDPTIPTAVDAVVRRALAREPGDRFQSAADFADALEHAARAHGMVPNVRETSAFVNEMIGVDIGAQREVVRALLARGDISKSGVARADPVTGSGLRPAGVVAQETSAAHAAVPGPPPPAIPPPPVPLPPVSGAVIPLAVESKPGTESLADDDFDMPTRIDVPLEEQAPVSMSMDTSQEFRPLGALVGETPPPAPAAASGPLPAMPSGPLPGGPTASGGWNAQWVPPQPVAPVARRFRGLPLWTLAIPAALALGAAVVIAFTVGGSPSPSAAPSATAAPDTATAQTATAADTATPAPTTTAAPSAPETAAATQTATAAPVQTTSPRPTAAPRAPTAVVHSTKVGGKVTQENRGAFGGRK